ncbi:MAG: hypothetical protein K2N63_05315, partial [Lachnospiraceae bacterium]|nr:hypothetical protein [Lachnospiraceae bacterium]
MLKSTVFLICYIPMIFLWEMFCYKKGKTHRDFKGWLIDICFYIYIFLVVRVTIFPVPYQKNELDILREMFGTGLENNIVPFCSIMTILK